MRDSSHEEPLNMLAYCKILMLMASKKPGIESCRYSY